MDSRSEKAILIERILRTTDEQIIQMFNEILESRSLNFPEELPDSVKELIAASIEEANRGEWISHEQVMRKYGKWLAK